MKTFYEFWNQIQEQVPMPANAQAAAPAGQPAMQPAGQPAMQPAGQPAMQPAGQAANQTLPGADPEQKDKLQMILGKSYPAFVTALGSNIRDPKFIAFLEAGLKDGKPSDDDKVPFTDMEIECTQLKPTQKEIDINQSLAWPLTKTSTNDLLKYFRGGTFAIAGKSIVTCGGGKYIVDGHHRWSQLYCMNPKAKIKAVDMTEFEDPVKALKIAQVAIAATQKKIPVDKVFGTNLIGIDEATLKKYVTNKLDNDAYAAFAQLYSEQNQGKQESNFEFILNYLKNINEYVDKDGNLKPDYDPFGNVNQADTDSAKQGIGKGIDRSPEIMKFCTDYIWKNVQLMNETSKPIPGASARGYMPQTDDKTVSALQAGTVNWKHECLKLAGIVMRD